MIDLRSDTVTRPTPTMLDAMMNAPVGDDVFEEDPSINALEEKSAALFGKEAALFCPSGTMTNQIAINVHTRPGDEVVCHEYSHIYNYEGGAMAFNSSCQPKLLKGDRGLLNSKTVEENINPDDVHAAHTGLISLENTSNKGGGSCYDFKDLKSISELARKQSIPIHLDGARLFNALVAKGESPREYGPLFDSISICLSKGLGCPVGSLVLGSKTFVKQARRVRKKLGGGMRQAGYLAAAGIYALDHHIDRLKEDHLKAKKLEAALNECTWISKVEPVETNIVIFYLKEAKDSNDFTDKLLERGIHLVGMGQGKLRFVTHLDVNDEAIETVVHALKNL